MKIIIFILIITLGNVILIPPKVSVNYTEKEKEKELEKKLDIEKEVHIILLQFS